MTKVLFVLLAMCALANAQEKQLIQPSDCVGVRYLSQLNDTDNPIQVNTQGTRVAYLVQIANLEQNRDDVELSVIDLTQKGKPTSHLILTGPSIKQANWFKDGLNLSVLANVDGHVSVVKVNVTNGDKSVLASSDQDIVEYSMDRQEDTIVFATEQAHATALSPVTQEQTAKGYQIQFHEEHAYAHPRRELYVTRMIDGKWSKPVQLAIWSPATQQLMPEVPYFLSLRLSLSPDGRFLLMNYIEEHIPEEWQKIPSVQSYVNLGFVIITAMTDLASGITTIPLETITMWSVPVWSPDGQSFVAVALSPLNSEWEASDVRNHLMSYQAAHLFWVKPATGRVEQVASHVVNLSERPLAWISNEDLVVHTSSDTVTRFGHTDAGWKVLSSFHIPLAHLPGGTVLSSNGTLIVGEYETPTMPPQLFLSQIGQNSTSMLTKLNPQFDNLVIASEEDIQWETSTGYSIDGELFLPPGYKEGHKYPLVIQVNGGAGNFVCDSGSSHFPSEAPQPIADAGMLYLMRRYPEDWNMQDEQDHSPKGYPGNLGATALWTDAWDSAVEELNKRGMIDPDKVGIIGFSSKGFITEFSLVHGKTHYRAASATDNVEYTFTEYWMNRDGVLKSYDAMYGGPPYGSSLKNWLDNSISFNLDKVHTPLLMEVMGYGYPYNDLLNPPLELWPRFEIFTGLNRLEKPVELYYYPQEEHLPKHPQARLANVQRNVDWYRFWLQGYERANPEDPDQYKRWEHLRELRDADTKTTIQVQTGSPKPN